MPEAYIKCEFSLLWTSISPFKIFVSFKKHFCFFTYNQRNTLFIRKMPQLIIAITKWQVLFNQMAMPWLYKFICVIILLNSNNFLWMRKIFLSPLCRQGNWIHDCFKLIVNFRFPSHQPRIGLLEWEILEKVGVHEAGVLENVQRTWESELPFHPTPTPWFLQEVIL